MKIINEGQRRMAMAAEKYNLSREKKNSKEH